MAIKNRQGKSQDFVPTKLLGGEFAVVQEGDANTADGSALYLATKAGSVKRIPFATEVEDLKAQVEEVVEDAREAIESAIDPTLKQSGKAADAKVTGDEIADLKGDISDVNEHLDSEIADVRNNIRKKAGLSEEAKIALLDCFEHVAWIDEHGQTYYGALYDALYPDTGLDHITAVFTQGSFVVYPSKTLNDLKPYLTVTGYYKDGSSERITDYALSGTLAVGISTITVIKDGKTATFDVVVSEDELQSISAAYDSDELILTVDSIDKLRDGLTVTAHYTDGTDEAITDYTLSGTLASGTNNVRVTYEGKETTFNVSASASHYLTQNDIESNKGINISIDATGTPTHVSTGSVYYGLLFKPTVVKLRTRLTEWLDQSHFTIIVYKDGNNIYGIDPGTVNQYVPTERCKLSLTSAQDGYDKESDYTTTVITSFYPVQDWPSILIPYADTDVIIELTSGKVTISDTKGNAICSVNAPNANRLGYWGSFYLIGTYFTNIVIIDS